MIAHLFTFLSTKITIPRATKVAKDHVTSRCAVFHLHVATCMLATVSYYRVNESISDRASSRR